jgi:hypothetical protein
MRGQEKPSQPKNAENPVFSGFSGKVFHISLIFFWPFVPKFW